MPTGIDFRATIKASSHPRALLLEMLQQISHLDQCHFADRVTRTIGLQVSSRIDDSLRQARSQEPIRANEPELFVLRRSCHVHNVRCDEDHSVTHINLTTRQHRAIVSLIAFQSYRYSMMRLEVCTSLMVQCTSWLTLQQNLSTGPCGEWAGQSSPRRTIVEPPTRDWSLTRRFAAMKSPRQSNNHKLEDAAATGGFQPLKTPEPLDLEGGALRPGGAPNLLSKQHIGLIFQYGVAGIVYGSVYGSIYPFLTNYLRMSGIETTSAGVLVTIPATLKIFIGIVTDCLPVFGYRRRPYMVLGWVLAFSMLLVMACTPIGDPYYPDRSLANVPVAKLTPAQVASFNTDAPDSGVKYIFLMSLAYFGAVIAVTASDGILVELAQREPEKIRGTAQTTISMAQDGFMVLSSSMVGFGMNGPEYGGSFSGSLGFNALMSICAGLALINIFSALFFVSDTKVAHRQSARKYFVTFFDLLSERVVYQIIAFRFCRNLFSNFGVTASAPIQSVWAQVEPLNSSIATILGRVISVISLYFLKKYGLQWNWRRTLVITQVAVVAIDCIPTFFTIWDVYRSQWFWLGVPLLEKLPNSMGNLISGYAVMEIIGVGHEASVYGLITTVATLASPFSSVLTKNVDAHFDIGRTFLVEDDSHARTQVTYAYLIAYGFKLFSCVFVLLLPRQKKETQELKRVGGKNKIMGVLVILVYLFTLEWSVMTNMMTMFTSTKCLIIAGGTGCK